MYATDKTGKFVMVGDKVVDNAGKHHKIIGYAGYNFITTQEGHTINAVQCEVTEATNITFTQYQKMSVSFSIYPDEHKEEAYSYGIASEVGEYLSLWKKYLRGDGYLDNNKCLAELGDICWYITNWLSLMYKPVTYVQQEVMLSSKQLKEILLCLPKGVAINDVWTAIEALDVVSTLAKKEHNSNMSTVLRMNLGKLTRRYYNSTIKGSGDER